MNWRKVKMCLNPLSCATFLMLILLNEAFANEFTPDDRKLLADLPELNSEKLRWMVPADGWGFKKQHLAKGKFFRISSEGSILNSELLIYKTPSVKVPPAIKIAGDQIWTNGKWICDSSTYNRSTENIKQVISCSDSYCSPLNSEDDQSNYRSNKFSDSNFLRSQDTFTPDCILKIDFFVKAYPARDINADSIYDFLSIGHNTDRGRNYYFKYSAIAKDNSYLVIPVNGVDHYLDIRSCNNESKKCSVVDIEYSDFEKDWIRLKKHQQNKDLLYLNLLISELRPCVEKKDIKCIERFFPDSEEHDYLLEWKGGYKIPDLVFNDELINELSACLDYKNLLPHLQGLRGLKKVCIFQERADLMSKSSKMKKKPGRQDLMLLNVTYPEAVRVDEWSPIYINE